MKVKYNDADGFDLAVDVDTTGQRKVVFTAFELGVERFTFDLGSTSVRELYHQLGKWLAHHS